MLTKWQYFISLIWSSLQEDKNCLRVCENSVLKRVCRLANVRGGGMWVEELHYLQTNFRHIRIVKHRNIK